jgi:DNA replication protein DnaC
MPDPIKFSGALGEVMARMAAARERAALAECPEHGGGPKSAIHCQGCAADRLTGDPEARVDWNKTAAMVKCDEMFPRRFVDAVPDTDEVIGWVKEVEADPKTAPSLLLFGSTGTGKTHQAYGALRAALLAAPRASWATTTFPDFAAALRPRQGVDTEAEMDRFRSSDLLLLDDVGTAKGSEWVEEITYRLINGRYEDMKPSIFTTNLSMPELKAALGDRIAGRLAETCTRVALNGRDWRRQAAA